MRNIFMIPALLALFVSAGFAESTPRLPSSALPVPIVAQATDYSCGAAALLSVLYYWQAYDGGEVSLYEKLGTTAKDGTEPVKIAEVAVALGLRAQLQTGLSIADLRERLVLGDTVILDLQSGPPPTSFEDQWEDGHYVVLVAMDRDHAYLMDPVNQYAYSYVPLSELEARWHDYEDRHGKLERHIHLGILIHGHNPISAFPGRLVRMK